MPLLEPGAEMSFAQRQVVTARNIRGGRLMDLLLGGLNYQIEHHLFPNMPRPNLTRAQGIVRDFCLANNFGYREDSLLGSYRQTIRSLQPA
jgi:fatty acid desaturase